MAKRNKLEIIRDILRIIQESHSIKPTPLLRRSNISSSRFKGYYLDLLEKEFIRETSGKNKKIILTKKGNKYLEKYSTIINFIEEFEL
jgi:predicted transcriptional regulator